MQPEPALTLSEDQQTLISPDLKGSIFLEGPAGSGKTTVAVLRMTALANEKTSLGTILVLVPQRSLAAAYHKSINSPEFPAGPLPSVFTVGGLAQRMVDLFWPLVAATSGFKESTKQPKFLTLETAQYYMAKIVSPMIAAGDFQGLSLDPNRLYSQILDNLNKAAIVGFPHTQIGERLSSAWMGDPGQLHIFTSTQTAATRFREYCLDHNLLDFSLQVETFIKQLWISPLVRKYLNALFSHLIFDNVEEDVPVAHDLIREWLPDFKSSLLIYNRGGGFRSFLGADPSSGYALKQNCSTHLEFTGSFEGSPVIAQLGSALNSIIRQETLPPVFQLERRCFEIRQFRFATEMAAEVCEQIDGLVHREEVAPGEIVVISPYMSAALRFALQRKLGQLGIPNRSSRPSRSLAGEPAVRTLLALAKIAFPSWKLPVSPFELRSAFAKGFMDGDLNRAELLIKIVAPHHKRSGEMVNFSSILPEMQSRITFIYGERYELLRKWLMNFMEESGFDLDVFFGKLFGEVLSQKNFGFHDDLDAAALTEQLIVSVQKFRRLASGEEKNQPSEIGKEYIQMLESGVLAAQYFLSPQDPTEGSVLLSPAYSFLMSNRAVRYQFWLDSGSHGWWERLFQPLTQPHVLSRNWTLDRKWTDADEYAVNQETMARLVNGLLERCTGKVVFCTASLNESGVEEKGRLLQTLQSLLKRLPALDEHNV